MRSKLVTCMEYKSTDEIGRNAEMRTQYLYLLPVLPSSAITLPENSNAHKFIPLK